jgi:hypothetical protein
MADFLGGGGEIFRTSRYERNGHLNWEKGVGYAFSFSQSVISSLLPTTFSLKSVKTKGKSVFLYLFVGKKVESIDATGGGGGDLHWYLEYELGTAQEGNGREMPLVMIYLQFKWEQSSINCHSFLLHST